MGIQAQIDRINQNISNTYAALSALGADIPAEQTSDNLSRTAGSAKAVLYAAQALNDGQKEQARENIDALGVAELPEAIEDALAQAKASGEFKGEKGDTGATGPQGPKGDAGDRVWNLLDNSDFRNPVNQRRETSYSPTSSNQYTIDRWKSWSSGVGVAVESGGVRLSYTGTGGWAQFTQALSANSWAGKKLTFAICIGDTVYAGSATAVSGSNVKVCDAGTLGRIQLELNSSGLLNAHIYINPNCNMLVKWAALYEGEYTVETLPAYVPKGYAHELLECQRYFYALTYGPYPILGYGHSQDNGTTCVGLIPVPVRMIRTPTLVGSEDFRYIGGGKLGYFSGGVTVRSGGRENVIELGLTGANIPVLQSIVIFAADSVAFSADL